MITRTVLSFQPEPTQPSPRPQGGGQGAGIKIPSPHTSPLEPPLGRGSKSSACHPGAIPVAPSFPREVQGCTSAHITRFARGAGSAARDRMSGAAKRESMYQTGWIPCLAPLARNDATRRCYKSSALAPRHSNLPWGGDQNPRLATPARYLSRRHSRGSGNP